MVRNLRKCSSVAGEPAVASPVGVGVRTRSKTLEMGGVGGKRRKLEAEDWQISYLQLRSRTLVMTPTEKKRITSTENCSVGDEDEVEEERIESRCASNSSGEQHEKKEELVVAGLENRNSQGEEEDFDFDFESASCNLDYCDDIEEKRRGRTREETPFSKLRGGDEDEFDKLESSAARRADGSPCRRTKPAGLMPSQEEMEEFFASVEKEQAKKFAEKYNYDVVKDVPLEGRYEWEKLNP